MKCIFPAFCTFFVALTIVHCAIADKPLDIGNRRELFIDDYMIGSMKNVSLKMHEPVRREISIKWDKPWEGCGGGYTTVFQDGDIYRMYYHVWQIPGNGSNAPQHPLFICHAQSKDGIHWTRPDLGLCEFQGSKNNNIILDNIKGYECHDLSPFIDTNPKAAPDGKYKAIGLALAPGSKVTGLWAFKSPDAVHWTLMKDGPVYTQGAFDTQNIAFWSEKDGKYVLYYRVFTGGKLGVGVRHIERAFSDDFINWQRDGLLDFGDGGPTPDEQVLRQPDQALLSGSAYSDRFPGPICRSWTHALDLPSPGAGESQASHCFFPTTRNRGYRQRAHHQPRRQDIPS